MQRSMKNWTTHALGVGALILGGVMIVIGLIAGFGFMFAGIDDMAKRFLPLVPLGFLAGFVGVVMTLLGRPD